MSEFKPVTGVKKTIYYPHKSKTDKVFDNLTYEERKHLDTVYEDCIESAEFVCDGEILVSNLTWSCIVFKGDHSFIFRYYPRHAQADFQHRKFDPLTGKKHTVAKITHDVFKNDKRYNPEELIKEFFKWSDKIVSSYL